MGTMLLSAAMIAFAWVSPSTANDWSAPPEEGAALFNHGSGVAPAITQSEGEFRILTYNIAGLPNFVSSSRPNENTSLIAPLLDPYELVLVQEDFVYHDPLDAKVSHPYRSEPIWDDASLARLGDGLNRFSGFPIHDFERVAWHSCFGDVGCSNDCVATKGFTYGRSELAPGVFVDVYNLHAEAGTCGGDYHSRSSNIRQLSKAIDERSSGNAVIVAGDFNLRVTEAADALVLETFLERARLNDTCDALGCDLAIEDHVMVRNSPLLELTPLAWSMAPEFVDAEGEPLSDHPAVWVRLRWELTQLNR